MSALQNALLPAGPQAAHIYLLWQVMLVVCTLVFVAVTLIQPSRDLGVAVFANAGGERGTKASTDAVKALIRRFAASP